MKYIIALLGIIPSWILIGSIIYIYVFSQLDLIINGYLLSGIIVLGVCASFFFSGSEMALATMDNFRSQLSLTKIDYTNNKQLRQQEKNLKILILLNDKERVNTSIVICNNFVNTGIAALIPLALSNDKFQLTLQNTFPLWLENYFEAIGYKGNTLIPGAGTEMLTFASAVLLILVFGEVFPKRIAMKHSKRFIMLFGPTIMFFHNMTSWIGNGLTPREYFRQKIAEK